MALIPFIYSVVKLPQMVDGFLSCIIFIKFNAQRPLLKFAVVDNANIFYTDAVVARIVAMVAMAPDSSMIST